MTPEPAKQLPLLRLCLDLNIWCAHLISERKGYRGTAVQLLTDIAMQGRCAVGSVQLVISWAMLNRSRKVLDRDLKIDAFVADALIASIIAAAGAGPRGEFPHLVLGGTGILPLRDEEDAHVLDVALASRSHLLVTKDFDDFVTRHSEIVTADRVCIHRRADWDVVIAHPADAVAWLRQGLFPSADNIRAKSASGHKPG
jgi:predicted nucleic acid-binding protein